MVPVHPAQVRARTARTRTRSRATLKVTRRRSFSGTVSPLGAALMGKKKGDVFTFETPNGKQTYLIEKVA